MIYQQSENAMLMILTPNVINLTPLQSQEAQDMGEDDDLKRATELSLQGLNNDC